MFGMQMGKMGGVGQMTLAQRIAYMFANSEQGAWYDPSDMSTMFQDAAGTLPCYMPGGGQVDPPVGRILDKSGHGNHASQATTTSRPTLSARYNALLASEKFDDAYWGFTSNYAVEKTGDVQDPSGGSNAWKITSTTGSAALIKFVGAGFKNPVYTVTLRAGSRDPNILVRNATTATNLVGGSTSGPSTSGTYGKFTNADLGGGWRKLTIEVTSGVATSDVLIVYLGSTSSVATGQYFYAYRAEFREGNDGVGLPEYQRVVDANTYDTAGFPPYLKFDGVDDFLQTASVDFSGTDKALVAAAARKLSDAAIGCLVELSSWGGVSGALSIQAPRTASNNLSAALRDATSVAQYSIDGVASPSSFVLRAMFNISATGITNQIGVTANGATPSLSVSSAGPVVASALANAPIYIGRRAGTSQPFNGRLYGLLIRGAATPDATVAMVERYLNSKARIY